MVWHTASVLQRVCVYCGSSPGFDPQFAQQADALGRRLAAEGLGLVYGGGKVGLMGIVADGVLAGGGEVVGIIPEALAAKELAHPGLTELLVVSSMHERKALMEQRADGFVAMPGGFGTYDELFEILTWAQLGEHDKPVVLFDIADFYAPLFALIQRAVGSGFLKPQHAALATRALDLDEVVAALRQPPAPALPKWLGPSQI